jgi:hypothetical protein
MFHRQFIFKFHVLKHIVFNNNFSLARRNVGAAQKLSKLSLYNITYQIPKLAFIAGTLASASAVALS